MGVGGVKVYIEPDEAYPDYRLHEDRPSYMGANEEIEVHQLQLNRWKRGIAIYEQVQHEMAEAYKAAGGNPG
jgi:hypothetical protein